MPILSNFVVMLLNARFWNLGGTFLKCLECVVKIMEWCLCMCGFSNKVAIIYISIKVPYGCCTFLPSPPGSKIFNHPTFHLSVKGINCGQCLITM